MKKLLLLLFILNVSFLFSQNIIISEEILIMNDSIRLPGTLTYNSDLEQQPLVIFVVGSGNPDRNGNQLQFGIKANYIKQFSDAMTQNNVAFFRYDKRNVSKENIPMIMKRIVFQDLVDDVTTVINHFKDDKRFSSITLIGHSQGSLVAMLAANEHVDKYISLAGAGEPVGKTIVRQYTAQNEVLGESARQHIEELTSTGTIKNVNPSLALLFQPANYAFLMDYLVIDPSEQIKTLSIPVLILNGNKDLQVEEKDAKNLHAAKPKSEMVIIDKMNHVLKTIEKDEDNVASYASPDFPLSEELVSVVTAFIKK